MCFLHLTTGASFLHVGRFPLFVACWDILGHLPACLDRSVKQQRWSLVKIHHRGKDAESTCHYLTLMKDVFETNVTLKSV